MVPAIASPEGRSSQPWSSRSEGREGSVSRRTTSEKLSPDLLHSFRRSYAAFSSEIVVEPMHACIGMHV